MKREAKKFLLDYYDSTCQYYGAYHNHKETCAWAGLALHLIFCGLILSADVPTKHRITATIGFTVIVLLVAFFVLVYVRNQLAMKDRAGALAGAAKHLLAEILVKQDSELRLEDYLNIVESADTKAQSSHVLPERLLQKADLLNTRARGYQDRTRLMIHTLLFLTTVSTIAIKWILV